MAQNSFGGASFQIMTCRGAAGAFAFFAQQNLMLPHLYIGDKMVKDMDQGGECELTVWQKR